MASVMIGRTQCPECGFDAAHVKQSERALYRYCPVHDCGAQYFPRGQAAKDRLMAKTRPLDATAPATAPAASAPPPAPAADAPPAVPAATATGSEAAPPPPPPAPRKRIGIF